MPDAPRLQDRRRRLRGQELVQGQGRLRDGRQQASGVLVGRSGQQPLGHEGVGARDGDAEARACAERLRAAALRDSAEQLIERVRELLHAVGCLDPVGSHAQDRRRAIAWYDAKGYRRRATPAAHVATLLFEFCRGYSTEQLIGRRQAA